MKNVSKGHELVDAIRQVTTGGASFKRRRVLEVGQSVGSADGTPVSGMSEARISVAGIRF